MIGQSPPISSLQRLTGQPPMKISLKRLTGQVLTKIGQLGGLNHRDYVSGQQGNFNGDVVALFLGFRDDVVTPPSYFGDDVDLTLDTCKSCMSMPVHESDEA